MVNKANTTNKKATLEHPQKYILSINGDRSNNSFIYVPSKNGGNAVHDFISCRLNISTLGFYIKNITTIIKHTYDTIYKRKEQKKFFSR